MEENNTQSMTAEVTPAAQAENTPATAENTAAQSAETKGPIYANFFWRMAAVFTDIWIGVIFVIFLSCFTDAFFHLYLLDVLVHLLSSLRDYIWINFVVILLIIFFRFIYDVFLDGNTPGRLLYGLRVTDNYGKPLKMQKKILRSLISIFSLAYTMYAFITFSDILALPEWQTTELFRNQPFLPLILVGMTLLFIATSASYIYMLYSCKQTFYDKFLGTAVIRTDKKNGCFVCGWAFISISIFCLTLLVGRMLEGLGH